MRLLKKDKPRKQEREEGEDNNVLLVFKLLVYAGNLIGIRQAST